MKLVLTNEGLADINAAKQNGLKLEIAYFKVYRTGGTPPVAISDEPNSSILSNWASLPSNTATFTEIENFNYSSLDTTVSFTCTLGPEVGNFDYDAIGVFSKTDVCLAIGVYDRLQSKRATGSKSANRRTTECWFTLLNAGEVIANLSVKQSVTPYTYITEYNAVEQLPQVASNSERIYRISQSFNNNKDNLFKTFLVHAGIATFDSKNYQEPIWIPSDHSSLLSYMNKKLRLYVKGNRLYVITSNIYEPTLDLYKNKDILLSTYQESGKDYTGLCSSIRYNGVSKSIDVANDIMFTDGTMVSDDKLIYAFTMTSGSIFPSTMTYVQGLLFGYNDDTLVSGALASVISTLNKHISSPDAHPQYLKKELFAQFLEMLVPVGYEYKTWEDNSPKQLFDSILGKETYWRKLRGVISVAVDENDPNINRSGLILGKKGDAVNLVGSPDVYPLYTKNVYERYDPATVINTVWTITANKNPVTEGESVTFTVKANNISDGIEVSYTVKEGTLSNNSVVNVEKTETGQLVMNSGIGSFVYTTTADENEEDPNKGVSLVLSAPQGAVSLIVPITDKGHHETVIHISSNMQGTLVLDEFYKSVMGVYPSEGENVRFIIDPGVTVSGYDTRYRGAVESGCHWGNTQNVTLDNYGFLLGGIATYPNTGAGSFHTIYQGNTAILSVVPLTVNNYKTIRAGMPVNPGNDDYNVIEGILYEGTVTIDNKAGSETVGNSGTSTMPLYICVLSRANISLYWSTLTSSYSSNEAVSQITEGDNICLYANISGLSISAPATALDDPNASVRDLTLTRLPNGTGSVPDLFVSRNITLNNGIIKIAELKAGDYITTGDSVLTLGIQVYSQTFYASVTIKDDSENNIPGRYVIDVFKTGEGPQSVDGNPYGDYYTGKIVKNLDNLQYGRWANGMYGTAYRFNPTADTDVDFFPSWINNPKTQVNLYVQKTEGLIDVNGKAVTLPDLIVTNDGTANFGARMYSNLYTTYNIKLPINANKRLYRIVLDYAPQPTTTPTTPTTVTATPVNYPDIHIGDTDSNVERNITTELKAAFSGVSASNLQIVSVDGSAITSGVSGTTKNRSSSGIAYFSWGANGNVTIVFLYMTTDSNQAEDITFNYTVKDTTTGTTYPNTFKVRYWYDVTGAN